MKDRAREQIEDAIKHHQFDRANSLALLYIADAIRKLTKEVVKVAGYVDDIAELQSIIGEQS